MNKTLMVSALSAALLLTGCQSVNTTSGGAVGVERKQYMFSMLSTDEVNQMYAQSYQKTMGEAKAQGALDKTSNDAKRIQVIADRLIAQAPVFRPDSAQWNWEVNLIKSDELNANCGPGGKIMFYTGLIDQLKLTDAEIAAIMGHEMRPRPARARARSDVQGLWHRDGQAGRWRLVRPGPGQPGVGRHRRQLRHDLAQQPRQRERSRPDRPRTGRPRRLRPERGDHLVEQDGQGLGRRTAGVR